MELLESNEISIDEFIDFAIWYKKYYNNEASISEVTKHYYSLLKLIS